MEGQAQVVIAVNSLNPNHDFSSAPIHLLASPHHPRMHQTVNEGYYHDDADCVGWLLLFLALTLSVCPLLR